MTRKPLIVGGFLGAIGVAIAAATFLWLRPIDVTVANPSGDIPIEVFGLGTTEAKVVSKVGFEAAGTILQLNADLGQRVATGAVLARLNSREQEAKVEQARASVSQQEAAVHQAEASIESAQATLRQKMQVNERRQALLERAATSREAAEEAQAAYEIAVAALTQARSAADVARANLKQSRALLLAEEARLAKYVLNAPFDAVVINRSRELGAMVNPGEAIFTLVDPATTWVLAYVDEARAGRIRIAQKAKITLRSLPGQQFHGRVARIQIESDRVNEEWRVEITCDDCSNDLHLGEQAEVLISVAQLDQALLVPQAAISGLQGNHGVVWTVEGGQLARRAVMLGQRTVDGRWEIVGGMPKDAMVVTAPQTGLREGRAANVVNEGNK
ncbi:MAG: efflux RND transporter periplasmic adaptor subunit [Rhizobiales bacterium]|nr:efflux RND transporter periplasmic adaptor subunit [Hyphomicrobiales bacterium]